MVAPSSILSVLVLILTLLMVVAFAFAAQQVRYAYLQQLNVRLARTEEALSVGTWSRGTVGIIDVKNVGGVGIHIKEIKATITFKVYYKVGDKIYHTIRSVNKIFKDIMLSPYERKFILFSIEDELTSSNLGIPNITGGEIVFVSIVVATEKNVFVYDPAPPTDAIVLEIFRNDIGKGYTINLPNGRKAVLRVYEYLLCSIGPSSRASVPVTPLDSSKIYIMLSPNGNPSEGDYEYGYDANSGSFQTASINIETRKYNVVDMGKETLTHCSIASTRSLKTNTVVVSRGIILLGTQLSGYDIVAISYASSPYPTYINPDKIQGLTTPKVSILSPKSNNFELKIALPDSDVSVYDYLSTQITSFLTTGVSDKETVMNIGNYYSQAIIIGQTITGVIGDDVSRADIYVKFDDPYPIYVIIAPPPISS